jgi:GT2 family glycosyltransferase
VAERDGLEQRLGVTVAERDGLEQRLGVTVAERDGLEQRLGVTVAERDRLQEQLAAASRAREDLGAQLSRTRAEREHLEQERAHLEQELAREKELRMLTPRPATARSWTAERLRRPLRAAKLKLARARHRVLPARVRPFLFHNPLFDATWYRNMYEDVRLSGMDPERHFRRHGVAEGRDPNPFFQTNWYLEKNLDVAHSAINPLDHYFLFGAWEGRDPSPLFATDWYLRAYPDVRASGQNPLGHYLRHGIHEDRAPRPDGSHHRAVASPPTGLTGWVREGPQDGSGNGQAVLHSISVFREASSRKKLLGLVADHVPADSLLLVMSAPDDEPVIDARKATRFPSWLAGARSPALLRSSISLVAQLEFQRATGADFLVIPREAAGWLGAYPDFLLHLDERFEAIARDEPAVFYDLRNVVPAATAPPGRVLRDAVSQFRRRFGREPSILDWSDGRVERRDSDGVVFSPTVTPGSALPYLDGSVDMVVLSSGEDERLAEARRVALGAVVTVGRNGGTSGSGIEWRPESPELPAASLSIVIPNHNGLALLTPCLKSLAETLPGGVEPEVLVVDDASNDGSIELVRRLVRDFPGARLIVNETNAGFVASANRGAAEATGEMLLFLNNDTVLLPGWLEPLLDAYREQPEAGVVGGKLLYPDGRLQEAGGIVFRDGSAAKLGYGELDPDGPLFSFQRDTDYVSGALLMTPRALFDELDGFDRAYGFGFFEDTDYCFRVRDTARRVIYQPSSVIVHIEGGTAGVDLSRGAKRHQAANEQVFRDRWQAALASHPERPSEMRPEDLLRQAFRTPEYSQMH